MDALVDVNEVDSSPTEELITEADREEMLAIIEKHSADSVSDDTEELSQEDSQTSEDADESPEETADEAEPEESKDANTRIRQLNKERKILEDKNRRLYARTKKAEEESSHLKAELVKYQKALQLLKKHYDEDLSRYQDEFADPVETENRLLKQEREWSALRAQLEREKERIRKETEESFKRQMQEEQIALQAAEVHQQFEDALSAYPGVTREQLAFAIDYDLKASIKEKRPVSDIADLAKRIDEENEKRYESRILQKNKAKVTAPKPMRSSNNFVTADPELDSVEDLAKHLDLKFGKDKWFK